MTDKPLNEETATSNSPDTANSEMSEEEQMEQEIEELSKSFSALSSDLDALIRSLKPAHVIDNIRRVDPVVFQRYFRGFRLDKIGRGRLVRILLPEVREKENVRVMQLLTLLWNKANGKVYSAVRELVESINPDVEAIESIDDETAEGFVKVLKEKGFKRPAIHICVRLNGVRFSDDFIEKTLSPSAEN
ncbi:MAG: hypothetical protein CMH54_15610 [Myxococcales bacterium]|nr:hypothetical protein [Myxococcales bacterium]|tara:strand:- start:12 stop:578 length:567 start_codon:yes stop_codon:yes gene_type:complete